MSRAGQKPHKTTKTRLLYPNPGATQWGSLKISAIAEKSLVVASWYCFGESEGWAVPTMFGRLKNWLHCWMGAKDQAAPEAGTVRGLSVEKLRSIRNTADYLNDAIKAAPGGQINPDDLAELKSFAANLDDLTEEVKQIKDSN